MVKKRINILLTCVGHAPKSFFLNKLKKILKSE